LRVIADQIFTRAFVRFHALSCTFVRFQALGADRFGRARPFTMTDFQRDVWPDPRGSTLYPNRK